VGLDLEYLDEMNYYNGMMLSKDLHHQPYNNLDIEMREQSEP